MKFSGIYIDFGHWAREISKWIRETLIVLVATAASFTAINASAQQCPFDDGNTLLTREGLVLTRYSLGLTGAALVAGTDFATSDETTIASTIACPECGLDINGSGAFDTVDATIISRKLAGYSGDTLTAGLALGTGSRNTSAAIQSFLLGGCGTSTRLARPGFRFNTALTPPGAGKNSSIAIGTDGLPLIAFYNHTAGNLQMAKCTTIDCASASISTIDSVGDVGQSPSLAIGPLGNGVVSYYDATNRALKLAFCADAPCTSASVETVDTTNDVGRFSSLIATDVVSIAYYDQTTRDLKFVRCGNAGCLNPTVITIDSVGDVGEWVAITLVAAGLSRTVAMVYFDATNRAVKVAVCNFVTCAGTIQFRTIETVGTAVAEGMSITTGADGNAVLSYARRTATGATNGRIAICNDLDCTAPILRILSNSVGNANSAGSATSISIGPDGLPFAVFNGSPGATCINSSAGGTIASAHKCTTATCAETLVTFPTGADTLSPSVTHGIDGLPIWSAWACSGGPSANGGRLVTLHCASPSCIGDHFRPR
jgi:hypothetical protein